MKSSELRKMFIDFFAEKHHTFKKSASLIPEDPSLLFNVAGMVPFKNYFLGKVPLDITRAVSAQKCIRTNDIENVGRTRRHHTFFEMLGNFSFGDYFKKEAIEWAWEFLTERVKLPKNRMYISIYIDDDEAFEIWNKKIKIPEDRIFRMGKASNFWEMGPVGPCGYCSEIYFDLEGGEKGKVEAKDIEENDDRFLEVWNLVFTQFDKKEDGTLAELKQKNIDTGMGLERLAAVSQGVFSSFETDLFISIINDVAGRAGVKYGEKEKIDISLRVIADHSRGVSFLINDGVIPSNEGRGYVLRRIIRRAVRHGRLLGFKKPFLYKVVPAVVHIMKEAYPEIDQRREYIVQIIKLEEDKFQETMDKGMEILSKEIDALKKAGKKDFPGETAFKLYDTFGFPYEITEEILAENGMKADKKEFQNLMEKQREAAKKAWRGVNVELTSRVPKKIIDSVNVTVFTGYNNVKEETRIVAMAAGKKEVKEVKKGETAEIIMEKTPFYAESGGQVGDTGYISGDGFSAEVLQTQKIDGRFIHTVKVNYGVVKAGAEVSVEIDKERRKAVEKNHTATHLLHSALRSILGIHVEQAGSYVGNDRLRFDFTHFSQLSAEETTKIEKLVNKWVQESTDINVREMEFSEAKQKGAIALFEEKYGTKVRTVSIGEVSMELCGGTHLRNTGEIGMFKILSSGSTAAGIRRIEAVTGKETYELVASYEDFIKDLKIRFRAADLKDLENKVAKLAADNKKLEKELGEKNKADVLTNVDEYLSNAKEINGIKTIGIKFSGADKKAIRDLGDVIKAKAKKTAALIANTADNKVSLLCVVTDDLTEKLDAAKIIKQAAALCKGGGGGRRDMAEAGGKDPSKIDAALSELEKIVSGIK